MAGARAHEADRKHPAGSPDDDQYSQPGEKADTGAFSACLWGVAHAGLALKRCEIVRGVQKQQT